MITHIYNGRKVIICQPEKHLRSWRERLFSLPWQPLVKTKYVNAMKDGEIRELEDTGCGLINLPPYPPVNTVLIMTEKTYHDLVKASQFDVIVVQYGGVIQNPFEMMSRVNTS